MNTYEKKYKEALSKAKDMLSYKEVRREDMEYLFPELAESEDEKVRKEITELIMQPTWKTENEFHRRKELCAWLEKQGEKDKPTYSTYSKDVQLTKEEYDKRRVSDEATIKEVEAYKKCLEDVQRIFEKQGGQNPIEEHDFLKILSNSYSLSFINYLDAHLYEGKMCVSNAECEDIENAFRNADWGKICRYYNKFTQKPIEWSEEDEKKCQETIDWFEKKCFPYALEHENPARESIKWLKSLKPQPKQEWSEEDMETIDRIHNFIWKNRKGDTSEIYQQEKDANWLKCIKDRVQPQHKQEWSEEDENMCESVIDIFHNNTMSGSKGSEVYSEEINWLESLKERIN